MAVDNEKIKKGGLEQGVGSSKEADLVSIGLRSKEREVKVPTEVSNWMDKLERNVTPSTYADPTSGQVILQPSAPTNPKVILPITQRSFLNGFALSTDEVHRWLSEFVFRFIKLKQGGVSFKQDE